MTRAWAGLLQAIDDFMGVPLACVTLLALVIVFGLLHYFWPRWVPKRLPRLRWWRRKAKQEREQLDIDLPDEVEVDPEPEEEPAEGDGVPEMPAHVFASLADRLAAEGRYAEAVRERLRAMVRRLIERQVLDHQPGMTVTELASAAGAAEPSVDGPMRSASVIFSDIWYGERPATAEHDNRMRALAAEVIR